MDTQLGTQILALYLWVQIPLWMLQIPTNLCIVSIPTEVLSSELLFCSIMWGLKFMRRISAEGIDLEFLSMWMARQIQEEEWDFGGQSERWERKSVADLTDVKTVYICCESGSKASWNHSRLGSEGGQGFALWFKGTQGFRRWDSLITCPHRCNKLLWEMVWSLWLTLAKNKVWLALMGIQWSEDQIKDRIVQTLVITSRRAFSTWIADTLFFVQEWLCDSISTADHFQVDTERWL